MKNNNCDGSGPCSESLNEVRVLPIGGDGNLILCCRCFNQEIQFRKFRNKELADSAKFALPSWWDLEVYEVQR